MEPVWQLSRHLSIFTENTYHAEQGITEQDLSETITESSENGQEYSPMFNNFVYLFIYRGLCTTSFRLCFVFRIMVFK